MAFRPFLLAAAAMLPMSLVACGGDDGQPVPEGTHYHFVANQVFVPTSNTQARDFGLDLNGDNTVDNQLGMVLSTLAGMGFDIQATIDTAVAEGSIILLVDFQTKDFTNTTAAGVQVFLGDNEMPAACNSGESYDPVAKSGCKHHLDGSGMFSIAAGSPENAALGGKIVNGTFTGGPGDLSLQIALGGTDAIKLDLIGARAKASMISENGIGMGTSGGVVFGGAVTKDDIDNKVIPAIQTQLVPIIMRDCTMPTMPPGCGCATDSTGKTILGLFDTNPKDCAVSVEEIKTNSLIVSLLSPDVTINGKMALSLGIKATAVKGTYTAPNQ
ncbi:MAG TPA: hypothetical protein VFV99_22890 [Kofleriaceae bacterium]|nr:hypothetical protein [Kofleriaceae bacterium]